jgi:ABC-type nitrate/sulfonate/bicarbonate transport system substrate-binding protein
VNTAGRWFVAALAVAALAGAVLPAGPAQGAGATYTLSVIDTTPAFFDTPLYAMINEGFAAANHLDLKLVAQVQGGSGAAGPIFAGGTGDVFMGGMDAPIRLQQSKTVDVTVIGTMLRRGVFVLVSKAGSPYHSLQSLKGQVVGISGPGAFSDAALRYALKQNGMTPDDVQIAALGGTPAQYAALLSDKAAAVQLQSPTLEAAMAEHKVQTIYDFRIAQGLIGALVFTARTAQVKANPGAYAAFMSAYRQVMHKFATDADYATKVATAAWGAHNTPEALKIQLHTYLREPGIWSIDGVFNKAIYDRTRAMLLGSGQFAEPGFPTFVELTQYAPPIR